VKSLSDGSNRLNSFATELQRPSQLDILENECGGPIDTAASWVDQADRISSSMCGASVTVNDLMGVFDCQVWYEIYETTVHTTLCYNVDNMSLVAFTQFFMAFFVCVLLTCRIVIDQQVETRNVQDSKDNVLRRDSVDGQGSVRHTPTSLHGENLEQKKTVSVKEENDLSDTNESERHHTLTKTL